MKQQQTYKGLFDSWNYEDWPHYKYKPDKKFDRKLAKARLKNIEREHIKKEFEDYDGERDK